MNEPASWQSGYSRIAAPVYRALVGDLLDAGCESDWVLQRGLPYGVFGDVSRHCQKEVGWPVEHNQWAGWQWPCHPL